MNRTLEHDIAKEALEGMTAEKILPLWNEFCQENYYEEIWTYDEFTLEDFISGMKPYDIAKMIVEGSFKPDAEYFTFDGNGNFKCLTEREALEEIDYYQLADMIVYNLLYYKNNIPEIAEVFEAYEEELNEQENVHSGADS